MKKTISIYIDDKLHEDLKVLAEKEMRPVSNLIEYILRKYLEGIGLVVFFSYEVREETCGTAGVAGRSDLGNLG